MASVLEPVSNQGAVEGHDSDGGHSPSTDMEYGTLCNYLLWLFG